MKKESGVRSQKSEWLLGFLLCLSGCGRYADFSLPPPAPGAKASAFAWKPDASPVLSPGDWDSVDVLNPSVARKENTYYNFYSGFDGKTWHTGLAISDDGFHWRKQGRIISPGPASWEGAYIAANGSALWNGSEFLYWYQAGPRETPEIGLAQSSDGKQWRKHPAPVLETGPRGSWDERGVADPYVLRIGDTYYMYYLGQDRARRQRLGVARSRDGVRWQSSARIQFSSLAWTGHSMKTDWVSPPYGNRTVNIGCCTRAATGSKIAVSAWLDPWMA